MHCSEQQRSARGKLALHCWIFPRKPRKPHCLLTLEQLPPHRTSVPQQRAAAWTKRARTQRMWVMPMAFNSSTREALSKLPRYSLWPIISSGNLLALGCVAASAAFMTCPQVLQGSPPSYCENGITISQEGPSIQESVVSFRGGIFALLKAVRRENGHRCGRALHDCVSSWESHQQSRHRRSTGRDP